MTRWALVNGPELIPVPLDPRHFKQLIAEIADVLIDSYSQLARIKKTFGKKPIETSSSPQRREAERKGSRESS